MHSWITCGGFRRCRVSRGYHQVWGLAGACFSADAFVRLNQRTGTFVTEGRPGTPAIGHDELKAVRTPELIASNRHTPLFIPLDTAL